MGDYRGEADESRWWRTGKIKFTSPSTLMMITTMMATLNPLWRPGSSNSNHSSAHSHFLSPHISPVNSPAIRWSLPSIVSCHCRHYFHRNCLIRASQRVPEENLALVAQPQVSNAIAAQLKSKKFLFDQSLIWFHQITTSWHHIYKCAQIKLKFLYKNEIPSCSLHHTGLLTGLALPPHRAMGPLITSGGRQIIFQMNTWVTESVRLGGSCLGSDHYSKTSNILLTSATSWARPSHPQVRSTTEFWGSGYLTGKGLFLTKLLQSW